TRIIENMLLPPGINILMILLGFFLLGRFYRTGFLLVISAFFSLVILSLPVSAYFLNYPNNDIKAISDQELTNTDAKAIIILGGGRYSKAPEFNQDTVSYSTLSRIRYGAYLHRKIKLPILVTGGVVFGDGLSEAELMQQSLREDFNVKIKWLEKNSRNTSENAKLSFELLQAKQITKIILVTDFSHIKRSQAIFEKAGFKVIPAPINFDTEFENQPLILSLIPTAKGLLKSRSVLREYMGQLWYMFRY
ncbi:MAG: YdcF family protein, partial [Thiohalomonadales bacterium]